MLDASALIALFSKDQSHHQWALDLFLTISHWQFQMPSLTLAEAMVHPARLQKLTQFGDAISALDINISDIEASTAMQIASIRADTALKMPDAVVLNQALNVGASIATTDHNLARVARDKQVGVFTPKAGLN